MYRVRGEGWQGGGGGWRVRGAVESIRPSGGRDGKRRKGKGLVVCWWQAACVSLYKSVTNTVKLHQNYNTTQQKYFTTLQNPPKSPEL